MKTSRIVCLSIYGNGHAEFRISFFLNFPKKYSKIRREQPFTIRGIRK